MLIVGWSAPLLAIHCQQPFNLFKMEKTFKALPPTMPNFVRFEKPAGLKQDGFKVDEGYDIANFTKQEAEDFAELMYRTFMEHWEKRKSKVGGQ